MTVNGDDTVNELAVYGGVQTDTIDGGTGTDTLNLDFSQEIVYNANSYAQSFSYVLYDESNVGTALGVNATDTVLASVSYTLAGNVENLTLTGAGADTLIGGDGSDTYYVDNAGDVVTETNADLAIGGNDLVYSDLAAYTLAANIENGRIGSAGAANLTGNPVEISSTPAPATTCFPAATGSTPCPTCTASRAPPASPSALLSPPPRPPAAPAATPLPPSRTLPDRTTAIPWQATAATTN